MPILMGGGGGSKLVVRSTGVPGPQTILNVEDTSTVLLLSMNGTAGTDAFVDSSAYNNTVTVFDAPVLSSATYKWGGTSGLFGGGHLRLPYTSNFNLSTGDWTMETWFNANAFSGFYTLISKDTYGANYDWSINIPSSTQLAIYSNGVNTNLTVTVPTMNTGQWYHVAIVRSAGVNTIYLDGVAYGSNSMSIANADVSYFTVGCSSWNVPQATFPGYIDDLRISRVARYTGNFTPPAGPFTTSDPTKLPSSPLLGQVVYADVGGTVAYICTDAALKTWKRFTSV